MSRKKSESGAKTSQLVDQDSVRAHNERVPTTEVLENKISEEPLIGGVSRFLLSTVVGVAVISFVMNQFSDAVPNIFRSPFLLFLSIFLFGVFSTPAYLWINKLHIRRRAKLLSIFGLIVLLSAGILVMFYVNGTLERPTSELVVAPKAVLPGYFSFTQPEFALALPNHVNPRRFPYTKMYILSTFDGDWNNAEINNPEDLGLIIVSVIQLPDKKSLDEADFSRNSTKQITQLYTSSSDPNFREEIVEQGYASVVGRDAMTMTLRLHYTDKTTGEIKTADLRTLAFEDEKSLRGYGISYIPSEETDKVVSTFNIP